MITYMDQGMILFLNSLKPSVGKELMEHGDPIRLKPMPNDKE